MCSVLQKRTCILKGLLRSGREFEIIFKALGNCIFEINHKLGNLELIFMTKI